MLTDDFLKQSIQNATDCYRAGMDAQRSVSPSIGEFAVQENMILRTAILNILLAYDSAKGYENVTVPAALVSAIEAARMVTR